MRALIAARQRYERVLPPWRRSQIRCALCGKRDVHQNVRIYYRVIFWRNATARVYCSRCAADVRWARGEEASCPLPRAVRS